MRSLLLAAMFFFAGYAGAQCGTNQLTTPPNFVSNNGGAVGGMVYFTLTVTAPAGIDICGFDVNTGTVGQLNGLCYLHQSVTDWNLLTGANNTAGDWCVIGCLTGTGNGSGTPSPLSVVNSTNSIELPAGQYLLGIGDGNFDHDYTNGNGANQTVSDANLTFDGGKAANVVFGATLFAPRVFNATIDYDVGGGIVSPCGASCTLATNTTIGSSCGGSPATVAELFDGGNPWDLSGADLLFTGASGTVTVTAPAQTAIVPAVGPDLGLGDDASSGLIPLGFTLGNFGLPCTDSISVQSNGCIWLGVVGSGDFSESIPELETQQARLCAYWNDLRPLTGGGGGTIHADVVLGVSCTVTFDQVFIWGGVVPLTFQIVITPTAMRVRYDPGSAFASSAIVGFHSGLANGGGATLADLNGGNVPAVVASPTLTLDISGTLIQGGSAVTLTTCGIPFGVGALLVSLGPCQNPGIPLPAPPFAVGCEQYVSAQFLVHSLLFPPGGSAPFGPIPAGPAFVGLRLCFQSAWLGSGGSSDAKESRVGDY